LRRNDFMNNELIRFQHSRLGIASFILGILLWAYLIILIILATQTDFLNQLATPIQGLKNDSLGLSGLLKFFFWLVLLFGIIPFAGHMIGLILGLVGTIQKRKRRVIAISGLVINGLYFLLSAVLMIFSSILRSGNL